MKAVSQLDTERLDGSRAEHIRRLVDAAPPLSDTVRSRLASILQPASTRPVTVVRREAEAA